MQNQSGAKSTIVLSYLSLIFVIFAWGVNPLIALRFYAYFSPTIRISFGSLVCAVSLLAISWKHRKELNKQYFYLAIPTGFFMALADILQKIGLQYTTPTHYAFLENLSVLIVPVLLFLITRKKPSVLTILAAALCLFSSFILTGKSAGTGTASFTGDLLCALAGIFYGVNIAFTGAFAKKVRASLYLMIQQFTSMAVSFVGTIVFDVTGIEKILFTFNWQLIVANVLVVFVISTLCWLLRTNAMKVISPTVVAVMMPFSSVVTMVLSVISGTDQMSASLVLGAGLGLVAIILSGFGDRAAS